VSTGSVVPDFSPLFAQLLDVPLDLVAIRRLGTRVRLSLLTPSLRMMRSAFSKNPRY
jgi:hypothetical protein